MTNNLSKHILATITYYDVMDYPMTSFEVWKYLTIISGEEEEKYSLVDVASELESEKLKRFIKEEKSFYFLKDRIGLVQERIRRNKISEEKYKKLQKMIGWMRFLPYIKMIGASGRMAMKNAEEKSDFDLLVILEQEKMWTGRAIVTLWLQILGLRRHGKKIKNRICLNHFITNEFFVAGQDLFSANDYVFLTPLYGFSQWLEFQKKNEWIKKFKPNFFVELENLKKVKQNYFASQIKFFLEKLFNFDFIEKNLKKWQAQKIKDNPKTKQEGGVIISEDNELAFWPNYENQGPKIFSNFKERLDKISQF